MFVIDFVMVFWCVTTVKSTATTAVRKEKKCNSQTSGTSEQNVINHWPDPVEVYYAARTVSSIGADLYTYVNKCLLNLFQGRCRGMSVVLTSEPGVDGLQGAVGAAPPRIISLVLHGSGGC